MPDWSYHPIFRPLLFRLSPHRARSLTFTALDRFGRLPGAISIVRWLGHMTPPPALQRDLSGIRLSTPVGLGAGLDPEARALPVLAHFGYGWIEIGPLSLHPIADAPPILQHPTTIRYPAPAANPGLDAICQRLDSARPLAVPLAIRLGYQPGASVAAATSERITLIETLKPYAAFFVLDTRQGLADQTWLPAEWADHVAAIHAATSAHPLLICVPPDLDAQRLDLVLAAVVRHNLAGLLVGGGVATATGRTVGVTTHQQSLELVGQIRRSVGPSLPIIASGGIDAPDAALRFIQAGATLVQLHSGLVTGGPGLAKRTNEALLNLQQAAVPAAPALESRRARLTAPWLWALLLGMSMVFGGILAALIAMTRVILPYDEAFVGLTRDQIVQINDHLLAFMAHDRVTLAGTMIAIGVLYAQLALHGIRQRIHWARQALLISAAVGFASFFLFLGFGYFDPLHAFVAVALFPMLLFGIRGRNWHGSSIPCADRWNDRAWRLACYGQLLFILLGAGLILAGLTITAIGVTSVFVPEDLAFLRTSAATLQSANARLIPLIAHDRAGFGGALVSNGLAVLLLALWGFRRGARWVWWTMLSSGVPGFSAALSVHLWIGYTDRWHVAPALAALLVFILALSLSYRYLADPHGQRRSATLTPQPQQPRFGEESA